MESQGRSLHKGLSLFKKFSSKYEQILSRLPIWSHLLKKSLKENFILVTMD